MIDRQAIARGLSVVLHPFVTVSVMAGTAAGARQDVGAAARSVVVVAVFTVVPLFVLMVRRVRQGAWENVDASNRADRPILYVAAAVTVVALLGYVAVVRPQPFMVRGVTATLGMLAMCAAATRWVKVSLHMAFAGLAATVLALMKSPVGYLLVAVLPVLLWSRVALRRHTPGEAVLGTIIGAGSGAAIYYP
jgi:membrane-associated phospholipid phosphatase